MNDNTNNGGVNDDYQSLLKPNTPRVLDIFMKLILVDVYFSENDCLVRMQLIIIQSFREMLLILSFTATRQLRRFLLTAAEQNKISV